MLFPIRRTSINGSRVPALGVAEDDSVNSWHEYFCPGPSDRIYRAREAAEKNGTLGIAREEFLLTYPLIEMSLLIPYSELYNAQQSPDGMSPLLRRCSEYADRGMDMLRLELCSYRKP